MRRLPAGLLAGLLLCSAAASPAAAADQDDDRQPILLTADAVDYDTTTGVTIARGHVELSRGNRRVLADRISYDPATRKVVAEGDVALLEPDGNTLFVRRLEIDDDLREGFVENVAARLVDKSVLAAASGERRAGNVSTLHKAVYSPCPVCAEPGSAPLWQLKAERVEHDQAEQVIRYRDAWFELFGLPVGYLPYFEHPDPTVKKRSGFLAPSIGSRSELGLFAQVPYYYVLAPNRDVTLAPVFYSEAEPVLVAELRDLQRAGMTQLSGSLTYTDAYQANAALPPDGQEVRGHIRGSGRYALGPDGAAGFELFLASDPTYLDRYNFSDEDVLQNRAYFERIWERNYWGLNAYGFQGLRPEDDQSLIPVALPLAEASLRSTPDALGAMWTLDANLLALTRGEGLDSRRASLRGGYELPWTGSFGDLWRLGASLRGDIYYTDGDPTTFQDNGNTQATGRVLPMLTLDWSLPLARNDDGWQHVIEPVVAGVLTTYGGNPEEIPNEDSTDLEFDDTNLFEPIRFTGLDRIESGPKVSYGLRFGSYADSGASVSGLIGQSWRAADDDLFAQGSGLEDNLSDFVGRIQAAPYPWLDLNYRFRLARDLGSIPRNDLYTVFGPRWLRFTLGYLSLAQERGDEPSQSIDEREELTAAIRVQVTEDLALSARTRRDLQTDQTIANTFGLIYTHPCLTLLAGYERNYTRNRDVGPSSTFMVRVNFRNLGEIGAGGDLGARVQ